MRKWYPALLVILAFAAGAIVYGRLPARVPIHWDLHGNVNGWGSPAVAAFVMPCVLAVVWLLLVFLPRADPLRANYEKFGATYAFFVNLIVTFTFLAHLMLLAAAMGMHVDMARMSGVLLGLLFLGMGNVLPRARRNWFVGIRTPWTLSSDRVWERTHRVAGYVFMAAGLVAVIAALIGGSAAIPVTLGLVVAAGLGSAAYSYMIWRQESAP